jgi:hypothetical protein
MTPENPTNITAVRYLFPSWRDILTTSRDSISVSCYGPYIETHANPHSTKAILFSLHILNGSTDIKFMTECNV